MLKNLTAVRPDPENPAGFGFSALPYSLGNSSEIVGGIRSKYNLFEQVASRFGALCLPHSLLRKCPLGYLLGCCSSGKNECLATSHVICTNIASLRRSC